MIIETTCYNFHLAVQNSFENFNKILNLLNWYCTKSAILQFRRVKKMLVLWLHSLLCLDACLTSLLILFFTKKQWFWCSLVIIFNAFDSGVQLNSSLSWHHALFPITLLLLNFVNNVLANIFILLPPNVMALLLQN